MPFPGDEQEGSKAADPNVTNPADEAPMEADQELAFAEGGDQLPWLEVDDDYEEPGVDTGRIIAFAAVGLMALVVLVGAIWWFARDRAQSPLVADGSTIEAPAEPYKTRPDDPGGREVEGTGDSSFKVAEGETVEGRVATATPPVPSIDRAQTGSKPVSVAGVGVQVGAYSSRAQAEQGWGELSARFDALSGVGHRVVEGQVDGGTIYRLQAVAGNAGAAETLCRSLKAAGGDCQVKP